MSRDVIQIHTGSRSFTTHSLALTLAENQFQFNCKIPGINVVNVFLYLVFDSARNILSDFFGFPLRRSKKNKPETMNASFRVCRAIEREGERDATSTTGLERLTA